MPEPLREGLGRVLDGLHPTAKRVLARTHGVWLADNIPGAAAVYFPCNMDQRATRGGVILLDAGEYPIELGWRDVHVPVLYWHALAGVHAEPTLGASLRESIAAGGLPPADHAMRYLMLHELGHALSLYAGEFDLSETGRFRVGRTDGFVRLSWRLTGAASARAGATSRAVAAGGVAPKVSLSLGEWTSVLDVLDADPALASPSSLLWVLPPSRAHALRVCRAAGKLTRAGFVTPAAALYPTEDYAETFAHAIMAAEHKITRQDRIQLDLPHCGLREIRSPYYSPWVTSKRLYLERALGLRSSD